MTAQVGRRKQPCSVISPSAGTDPNNGERVFFTSDCSSHVDVHLEVGIMSKTDGAIEKLDHYLAIDSTKFKSTDDEVLKDVLRQVDAAKTNAPAPKL